MESNRNNTMVYSGTFKNIVTPRLYTAYAPIPVANPLLKYTKRRNHEQCDVWVSSYKKMNVFSDPIILSGQKTSIILNINDIRYLLK